MAERQGAAQVPSLDDSLRVTVFDAARPLATRLWESWLPSGGEAGGGAGADADVASARICVADVLAAGALGATWRLVSRDRLGVEDHVGVVAMRLAWLPAL